MKNHSVNLKILVFIFVLLLVSVACGGSTGSDSGVLVATAVEVTGNDAVEEASGNDVAAAAEAAPAFYGLGDIIEVKEQQVALTSVELQGELLVATFILKNNGSGELALSTLLSFSAKNEQAELLEEEIFDCGSSLGGTIVSGDVVTGNICWKNGSLPARIYYDASLFGSGTVAWEVNEQGKAPVSLGAADVVSYAIGDVIEIKDHTISLVEVNITNGMLTATFLIENTGTEELNVSSLLSFEAKDSEGASLELEIFDCQPRIDGTIIVSDRARGNVCWKNASFPINIYYDASLFGSGTVVWQIME